MNSSSKHLPLYGIAGLIIILTSEIFLFLHVAPVGIYFTPLVWTGYILFVDGLNFSVHGNSRIITHRPEFLAMLLWSILCWLVFEAYNLYLQNWTYVGLPEQFIPRMIGYAWSFATIFPAILETAEFVRPYFKDRPTHIRNVSSVWTLTWGFVGTACLVTPLIVPQEMAAKMFGLVWVGFFFLLDPINEVLGRRSVLQELRSGKVSTALALVFSGLLCGVLWEFWNYWATAKWHYSVPLSSAGPKLFEMPLLGYLGFIPFAFECFAMWQFLLAFIPPLTHKMVPA